MYWISTVRGRLPRKQGLKRSVTVSVGSSGTQVRGRLPRKQGLKQTEDRWQGYRHIVRGRLPRKQGLKHSYLSRIRRECRCPRATSTKTRIETPCSLPRLIHCLQVRGRLPRKQGLKPDSAFHPIFLRESEGDFHENKD